MVTYFGSIGFILSAVFLLGDSSAPRLIASSHPVVSVSNVTLICIWDDDPGDSITWMNPAGIGTSVSFKNCDFIKDTAEMRQHGVLTFGYRYQLFTLKNIQQPKDNKGVIWNCGDVDLTLNITQDHKHTQLTTSTPVVWPGSPFNMTCSTTLELPYWKLNGNPAFEIGKNCTVNNLHSNFTKNVTVRCFKEEYAVSIAEVTSEQDGDMWQCDGWQSDIMISNAVRVTVLEDPGLPNEVTLNSSMAAPYNTATQVTLNSSMVAPYNTSTQVTVTCRTSCEDKDYLFQWKPPVNASTMDYNECAHTCEQTGTVDVSALYEDVVVTCTVTNLRTRKSVSADIKLDATRESSSQGTKSAGGMDGDTLESHTATTSPKAPTLYIIVGAVVGVVVLVIGVAAVVYLKRRRKSQREDEVMMDNILYSTQGNTVKKTRTSIVMVDNMVYESMNEDLTTPRQKEKPVMEENVLYEKS